jgi:hypothetical protein
MANPSAACDEGDRTRLYQFGVVAGVELFQLLSVFRFLRCRGLEQAGNLPDEINDQSMPFAPPVAYGTMASWFTYAHIL